MSCDSVMSDTSEHEFDLAIGFHDHKLDIPDITTWLKNPTDFIKTKPTASQEQAPDYSDTVVNGHNYHNGDHQFEDLNCSQLQVSMSYLPTAERLSVVTVKMRVPEKLAESVKLIYVKAYLIDDKTGKRTCKKKTRRVSLQVRLQLR